MVTYILMSHTVNTTYKCNEEASTFHRITGKKCYGVDVDMLECKYQEGSSEPVPVAVTDYKYPGKSLSDTHSSFGAYLMLSKRLDIPFFIIITYLDLNFTTKCYYVIPADQRAKKYFVRCKLNQQGAWLGLKDFSKFLHALRSQPWNGEEVVDADNLVACHLEAGTKLKELPNEIRQYPLPKLEFSWLKQ